VIEQRYLPNVEPECPVGGICMDVVYRWTIQIDKLISGKLSGKTVKAARIQHAKFIYAHQRQALYVLSYIEDERKRKLLGADYWLEEYAPPSTVYCLESNDDYGLGSNDSVFLLSGTHGCYRKDPNS